MDKLEFKKIHSVIIDFLKEESDAELEIIGSWYFLFLISDKEKLSLHVPYYSKEFSRIAFNYIRSFTVVYNLLKQEKIAQFQGTCLFDIFNTSGSAKIDELTLDFSKRIENFTLWGEDTITKLDNFLPVFNKEEILDFNKSKTIKNTFDLFKSLRNSKNFKGPLQIELKEKTLSFNNLDVDNEFISENLHLLNSRLSRKDAIEIYNEISGDFNNCNYIKYPYSLKPTFPLTEIGKKKFKLIFNNRFAYNEIAGNDIFLLKNETELLNQIKYSVIDTNHSKDLYILFIQLKEKWINLELNKFTTPFPKYWFLFLNPSLTKEEWLIQFKKDFPAVAEVPIIIIIEEIIKEVIGLNWIEKVLTDTTRILFPELKSNRKKRLEFVFNNFKNHITTLNSNVEFIDSIESDNYADVLVFDSFNIIDLANKNQSNCDDAINVIVPDFLYFGYQPWIKFHLFNYQFTPLFNGLRAALDDNYISNKREVENLKTEIIKEIKWDLKNYRRKYIEEIDEDIDEENLNSEDLEYTNNEEIEDLDSISENNTSAIINQNLENEVTIFTSEKVLLQKDTLIYIKAGALKNCDFFIRNSDISNLYNQEILYDKLVSIPNTMAHYQNELFKKEKVYQILRRKGLSIDTEYHFKKHYLIEHCQPDNFLLPRRKKDRLIICDLLNISKSDLNQAFVAHYGQKGQIDLKEMYRKIIELLLENNWLGTIENPTIIASVSKIVNQYDNIFKTTDTAELSDISESIISTILNQLTFTEVKSIKIIANE